MLRLLLLVIAVLSVELALLIGLVHSVGWLVTGSIGLATTLLGGSFAKRQGRRVWRDWQLAASSGRAPDLDALDPMLILAGSVLLMCPGLLTDVVGLLLLIPAVRRPVAHQLRPWLARRSVAFLGAFGKGRPEAGATRKGTVVDTEGEVVGGMEGAPAERPQMR